MTKKIIERCVGWSVNSKPKFSVLQHLQNICLQICSEPWQNQSDIPFDAHCHWHPIILNKEAKVHGLTKNWTQTTYGHTALKLSCGATWPTYGTLILGKIKKKWATTWQNQQNECAPSKDSDQPVWSESSLSTWRKLWSLSSHWAHSEGSDQTGRMQTVQSQRGAVWSGSTLFAIPSASFVRMTL